MSTLTYGKVIGIYKLIKLYIILVWIIYFIADNHPLKSMAKKKHQNFLNLSVQHHRFKTFQAMLKYCNKTGNKSKKIIMSSMINYV